MSSKNLQPEAAGSSSAPAGQTESASRATSSEILLAETIQSTEEAYKGNGKSDSLAALLPHHEARLIPGPEASDRQLRAEFPSEGVASNEAVASGLRQVMAAVELNGPTAAMREKLARLKGLLIAQLTRARAIRRVLEANPGLDRRKREDAVEVIEATVKKLAAVRDQASKDALQQTTEQRSEIMSLVALFEQSGCDGTANSIYWSNISPTPDYHCRARKEFSFLELPDEALVNGFCPLTETAVDNNGRAYPITLLPLQQKLVFQTRGVLVVLGGELAGLKQTEAWAAIANRAGAIAIGNCSLKFLGKAPFTAETPARLREAYASENAAAKSVLVCGNHPIAHDQAWYGVGPVVVRPAFVYGGSLYANSEVRSDLSFTNPPTNPKRDRVVGSWFSGKLVCPDLRDRAKEINELPLALLMEVSNERLDGINVVFSSSRTAWAGGTHTAELELGTNLARAIVTHRMLMCKGLDLTNEEAEAEGRNLNSTFQSKSGRGRPFLNARCDASKSRIQPQVQRKDDGTPITDAKGEPVLTGKKEMVHEISITYREGAENFLVVLTM